MNSRVKLLPLAADVTRFRVGDRVFARVAKDRAGAFAEQACVDEDHAAMPQDVDFTARGPCRSLGADGSAGVRDELGVRPGRRCSFQVAPERAVRCNSDRQMAGRTCDDNGFEAG